MPFYPWGESVDPAAQARERITCTECGGRGQQEMDHDGRHWVSRCDECAGTGAVWVDVE